MKLFSLSGIRTYNPQVLKIKNSKNHQKIQKNTKKIFFQKMTHFIYLFWPFSNIPEEKLIKKLKGKKFLLKKRV